MKRTGVVFVAAFALLTAACRTMPAAYHVEPQPIVSSSAVKVRVVKLLDQRPEEEVRGEGAGLMNRSTKDTLYENDVDEAITAALIDELRARNINAVRDGDAPYLLKGAIKNYRAMLVPPRTAFIPYISYVTWIWTKDRISAGVTVELVLEERSGLQLLNRTYSIDNDTMQWVGLVGLASSARRIDRTELVKFLHAGLKNVLSRAADDIVSEVK